MLLESLNFTVKYQIFLLMALVKSSVTKQKYKNYNICFSFLRPKMVAVSLKVAVVSGRKDL